MGALRRLAVWWFGVVLRLLPGGFVRAQRREMCRLFTERLREASESDVPLAAVRLTIRETFDLLVTAVRLRRRGRRQGAGQARKPGRPLRAVTASGIAQDAKHAFRQCVRRPAFSAMAVAVIGLGIGSTAAIFAIVDAVLLRPLLHESPEDLYVIGQTVPQLGGQRVPMAWPNYIDFRSSATGFSGMAAYRWPQPQKVVTRGDPESLGVSRVTGGLFDLLGNRALIGRTIGPADDSAAARVVVLGHGVWQTRFGGDPAVIGRTLQIEDEPYEIVGVMPERFAFPTPPADLWVPLFRTAQMSDRDTRFIGVVGRLSAGIELAEATDRMERIMAGLVVAWPENEGNGVRIDPLRDVVIGDAGVAMLVLLGSVLLLMLLACASVANLLLARTSARARELAVRRALGASRGRVLAQLTAESFMLALSGAVAGLALAAGATKLLIALVPSSLPRGDAIALDARTIAFTAMVTLASGLLFGLLPAVRASAGESGLLLRNSAGSTGSGQGRVLRGLVVVQFAITAVMLVSGGLLLNSYRRLLAVDTGFDASRVVTLRVDAVGEQYESPARVNVFFNVLVERTRALPAVTAAGGTWALPFTPDFASGRVTAEGRPQPEGSELLVGTIPVRGDYFAALGTEVVAGRVFGEADYSAAAARIPADGQEEFQPPSDQLAVVNEAGARAMFGEVNVVGRRFKRGSADEDRPWITIIGVVRDAMRFGLDEPVGPEVYRMHEESLWARQMSLVARTDGNPLALVGALRGVVRQVDPTLVVTQTGPLDAFVDRSVAEPRFRTTIVAAFAMASLVLALAGVYGVMAFAVTQRTREIGVRIALGAERARVVREVILDGATLVAAGLLAGLAIALLAAEGLRSLLFSIGPFDPGTWFAVVVLLPLAGLIACWAPARRASRVEPVIAMRD